MSRPVLLINPRAGGGKAAELRLAEEAARRGIDAIEQKPDDDLRALAQAAVARGAEALAMAGGDGSQAAVAAVAAEHGLPFACVPTGTRNHLAADLGIDRGDPVGALDALIGNEERRVDLGEVNGRVFVNNVALGLYAEAVNREDFREAKLRTVLDTVIQGLRSNGPSLELRWTDPAGGAERSSILLLISNNRLTPSIGAGSRPRLDEGLLGVLDVPPPGRGTPGSWRQLATSEFKVQADEEIAIAIDGEPETMQPPLRFRSRPKALRVRAPSPGP
ncbi:MAG TPA: diacylglycerol kinase family protein [Solirubrobacterales bacterium]|nr:diacylglycerol kinase family protein [Solirubrobacterales bacterium]